MDGFGQVDLRLRRPRIQGVCPHPGLFWGTLHWLHISVL